MDKIDHYDQRCALTKDRTLTSENTKHKTQLKIEILVPNVDLES